MEEFSFCNDRNCRGKINFEKRITVSVYQERCPGLTATGYPCSRCGLVHSEEMNNFFQERSGEMVYLRNQELVFG